MGALRLIELHVTAAERINLAVFPSRRTTLRSIVQQVSSKSWNQFPWLAHSSQVLFLIAPRRLTSRHCAHLVPSEWLAASLVLRRMGFGFRKVARRAKVTSLFQFLFHQFLLFHFLAFQSQAVAQISGRSQSGQNVPFAQKMASVGKGRSATVFSGS